MAQTSVHFNCYSHKICFGGCFFLFQPGVISKNHILALVAIRKPERAQTNPLSASFLCGKSITLSSQDIRAAAREQQRSSAVQSAINMQLIADFRRINCSQK